MYAVCPPPPDLARYVQMFWAATAEPGDPQQVERVVADGWCELIVHCGAPSRELGAPGTARRQPVAFLYGQLEHSLLIAPTGHVDLVAVRFTPTGVAALFGIDVRALDSSAVALDGLFGARGRIVGEQVLECTSRRERWKVLANFLRTFMGRRVRRAATVATHVLATLDDRGVHADAIAHQVGTSWRTIERAFDVAIGLSPRQFVQIRRVSAAANHLRSGALGLADIAAACGFADQAHFTRTFQTLVGISPGRYAREVNPAATIVPA
jgi:AraC-like DNA-binding protein